MSDLKVKDSRGTTGQLARVQDLKASWPPVRPLGRLEPSRKVQKPWIPEKEEAASFLWSLFIHTRASSSCEGIELFIFIQFHSLTSSSLIPGQIMDLGVWSRWVDGRRKRSVDLIASWWPPTRWRWCWWIVNAIISLDCRRTDSSRTMKKSKETKGKES